MGEAILSTGSLAGVCVEHSNEWKRWQGTADGTGLVAINQAHGGIVYHITGITEEVLEKTLSAGGTQALNASPVPSGKLWRITQVSGRYRGTTATRLEIRVAGLAGQLVLISTFDIISELWYCWSGEIVMQTGDYLLLEVANASAGDILYLRYAGVKMTAP